MFANEAMRRIFTAYELGDLITTCGWCDRVELAGEWVPPPRAALTAIDASLSLSHSICPHCAARLARERTEMMAARREGYSGSVKSLPSTTS